MNSIDCYPLLLRLSINKEVPIRKENKSNKPQWDLYPSLKRYVENMGTEEQKRDLFIMQSHTSRIF